MTQTAPPSPDPQRILIIKPSAIGDVVHTLPVLNLLRRRWPAAKIAWLLTPACAGLLEGHPQLDEIIFFERQRLAHSWRSPAALSELIGLARDLRRREFDLVIDLQGLFRSGWLTMMTGAPMRIGFANAREGAWLTYTHRIDVGSPQQHAVDRYLKVADALGCGRQPVEFYFGTTDSDRAYVADLLRDVGPFAAMLPGTNWQTKRWPIENFAALVAPLREHYGLATVIAGGSDVIDLARQIPGAKSAAGKTSLRELTALLERASLVIANDSGPMHIAAALGRPLVTMFGPTNPVRTGPYRRQETVLRLDIPCSPCYSRTCSHQSCLRWLTPGAVLGATAKQLNGHSLPVLNQAAV
jgi:heptosyltransferase-1